MPSITIPSRFNGPPESGNGGYTCGAIAAAIGVPVEVTLRLPPPLDTTMAILAADDGWAVRDGDRLIAEATLTDMPPPPPAAPSAVEAAAAAKRYLGHDHHEFPTCFTCGPGRDDGLAIFSGPLDRRDMVAAPWLPHSGLPNDDGVLTVAVVWAALDCPGAWTAMRDRTDAPVVLGRMTAHIERAPLILEPLVSYGWRTGGEGRKAYAGTALADEEGTPIAWAAQTWIAIR